MPNPGYMETRQAVAETLATETGLPFQGGDVIMTCGAAAAANVVLKTVLNPGDEVIILSPYFWEYLYYIDNHGGVPVVAATDTQFQLDLGAIEAAMTPKTRCIVINSPNNPTGAVYSAEGIAGLAALLRHKQQEHGSEIFPDKRRAVPADHFRRAGLPPDSASLREQRGGQFPCEGPGAARGADRVHRGKPPLRRQGKSYRRGLGFCNRTLGFVNAPALMQHIVRGLQGVSVDPRLLREETGLSAHPTQRTGLRRGEAPRSVLPVSQVAHRGRRGLHPVPLGVERLGGTGPGIRYSGLFPHILLRGRLGIGGGGRRVRQSSGQPGVIRDRQ